MWCSPLFFVSPSHLERRNYIFNASARKVGGGPLTLTATAVSHHKDLSFVCLNKENSNQKTDGYRLLPLSPAAEINDVDKHAHTQFPVSIVSAYLLSPVGL